jgi:putative hydrolase of the HAD superfamily
LGFDPSLVFLSYQYDRAKPDRYLFETARTKLDEYGIADRQTAFIGNDMRNDIVPAARVGFQTILFAGDQRSLRLRENESSLDRSVEPDLVVTDLQQLIMYL